MADFVDVMTGVSDASVFLDAAKAGGIDVGSLAGTIIIPINSAFEYAFTKLGISAGQLLAKPGAIQALLQYHISSTILKEPDAATTPALTTVSGKNLGVTVSGAMYFKSDSNQARKLVVYYVGPSTAGITTAIYLVDAVLIPTGFDLSAVASPVAMPSTTTTGTTTTGTTTTGTTTTTTTATATTDGTTTSPTTSTSTATPSTATGTSTGTTGTAAGDAGNASKGTTTTTSTTTGTPSTTSASSGTTSTSSSSSATGTSSTSTPVAATTSSTKSGAAAALPATALAVAVAAVALLA